MPTESQPKLNAKVLRQALTQIEREFESSNQIHNDPLSIVVKYSKKEDQEVMALIAAVFAYGNVAQIQKTLVKVSDLLGPSPAEILKSKSGIFWKQKIPTNFKHRFNGAQDLGLLLTWIGESLRQSGSLENFFVNGRNLYKTNLKLEELLEDFVRRMTALPPKPFPVPQSRGALFFFPKPSHKSACKRLLLFLRWVAGSKPMALEIWTQLPKEILIMPVDTHVLRIAQNLGLTKRHDASWRTALEITESLKSLTPKDPTRYDFALCHMGISKQCPSRVDVEICSDCLMKSLCVTFRKKSAIN